MTDGGYHPRLSDAASGQQKGSKRSKSSLCNRAEISVEVPQTRMNRAIARQSSPIVVSVEQACHTGGRGFESRRSRSESLWGAAARGKSGCTPRQKCLVRCAVVPGKFRGVSPPDGC